MLKSDYMLSMILVILYYCFLLSIIGFTLVSIWKIFEKAGRPGWECIVPIYNIYVMHIIGRVPLWNMILCFLPVVNIFGTGWMIFRFAKAFGRSGPFALGMIFLPFIFYPILAFGECTYIYGQASGDAAPTLGRAIQPPPPPV